VKKSDVTFDTEHNHDLKRVSDTLTDDVKVTQEVSSEQNNSETECFETVASVQTRAMVEKEKQPVKPLKVTTISGLVIGPEELKEKQRSDTTLKKYWDLVSKPESKGKPQVVVKKDILYRKYTSKQGDTKIQLVVPTEMRRRQ